MSKNSIISLYSKFIPNFEHIILSYMASSLHSGGYNFTACDIHGIFIDADGFEIHVFPCSCCDDYVFEASFIFENPHGLSVSQIERLLQKTVSSKKFYVTAEANGDNIVHVSLSKSLIRFGSSLKDPSRTVSAITEKAEYLLKGATTMGLILLKKDGEGDWSNITNCN